MKLIKTFFALLISLSAVSNGNAQANLSVVKGKVFNWPTDTVYLQTMPFYSPFSSELSFQTLNEDDSFSFEVFGKDMPLVVQLYSKKANAELNKEQLLFLNHTDNYYYGHCIKFYTYAANTILLEPGAAVNVQLKSNRTLKKLAPEIATKYRKLGAKIPENNMFEQVNETEIEFTDENPFQQQYFHKSFDLEDKVSNRLEIYSNKPLEMAIESFAKIRKKLLDDLEIEKENLSPTFYEYIKAEIEFGSRVEFLRFIMFPNKLEKSDELDVFFSNEISPRIMEIVEFNKDEITPTILASEAYNKYLELYLNFKISAENKKFSAYNKFGKQKCKTAIRELPEESVYYYIAGQLLDTIRTEDFVEDLLLATLKKFPEGELNDELMKKYDL